MKQEPPSEGLQTEITAHAPTVLRPGEPAKEEEVQYFMLVWSADNQLHSEPITPRRYDEVQRARSVCFAALDCEEKFSLLLENFAEFELELLRLAQRSVIWSHPGHHMAMMERLGLDRRLVNVLTACRLYLDQGKHLLSGVFGNPSNQLQAVLDFASNLYDTCIGYRAMESLRNFVLHAALPLNTITYSQSLVHRENPRLVESTIVPRASYQALEEGGFKKAILQELRKTSDDTFDLRPLLRSYIARIESLHIFIRSLLQQEFTSARETFKAACKDASSIGGVPARHSRLVRRTAHDTLMEIHLVTHFLDHYDELIQKNKVNEDLENTFASNNCRGRPRTG